MKSAARTIKVSSTRISIISMPSVIVISVICIRISYRTVPSSVWVIIHDAVCIKRTDVKHMPGSVNIRCVPWADKAGTIVEVSIAIIEDTLSTHSHNASVVVANFYRSGLDDTPKLIVIDLNILHLYNSTVIIILHIGIVIVSRVE